MAETPIDITIDLIEKKICDCLEGITKLKVVNERNPGPRVAESYISYFTLDAEGNQYPEIDFEGDPTELIIDTPVIISRIKLTGQNAFARLVSLCMSLRSSARNDDLYKNDFIGLAGTDSVQNITVPEPDFSRVLEQAVVRVSFYCLTTVRFPIDYFTKADIGISGSHDVNMVVDSGIVGPNE